MTWLQRARELKDTCLLCFQPIRDADAAVTSLGLRMHRDCVERDQGHHAPSEDERRAA